MALNLPLPKQVFGHPWLLFGNDKMSKSKGNILYADDLVDKYGVDTIRYYVLHEIPFAQDGSITEDLIVQRNNSDLANILGNLVNRTISMVHKYFDGQVPSQKDLNDLDNELIKEVMTLKDKVDQNMNMLKIGAAIDDIFEVLRKCNKYIDETTPWILAKEESNKPRLGTVLYNLLESIRFAAVLLQPFMPDTAEKIFNQLNTDEKSIESLNSFDGMNKTELLEKPEALFQRI